MACIKVPFDWKRNAWRITRKMRQRNNVYNQFFSKIMNAYLIHEVIRSHVDCIQHLTCFVVKYSNRKKAKELF